MTEHPILPPGTFDDYKATILHEDAEWNKFVKEAKVADHPELTEQKRLDAIRPPKYDALLRANFASAMITQAQEQAKWTRQNKHYEQLTYWVSRTVAFQILEDNKSMMRKEGIPYSLK
jgi:hypothetical protein